MANKEKALIFALGKIVFIADIDNDIDDMIAIEYLHILGLLECVVLDSETENNERQRKLEGIGVVFYKQIPSQSKIVFCGGALTKVAKFLETNNLDLLVVNGGFAGDNIVDNALPKFKGKVNCRTYNFNLDVGAAISVFNSKSIKRIILVSKNICHSELNCKGKLHCDNFLFEYDIKPTKRLHDLLMAKEGVAFMLNKPMICVYSGVKPIYERKSVDNMTLWGSELCEGSNIYISTKFH